MCIDIRLCIVHSRIESKGVKTYYGYAVPIAMGFYIYRHSVRSCETDVYEWASVFQALLVHALYNK